MLPLPFGTSSPNIRKGSFMTLTIIKLPRVESKMDRKKTWIYDQMAKGRFPRQVHLSAKAVGWVEEEIDVYIAERIAERDARLAARRPRSKVAGD